MKNFNDKILKAISEGIKKGLDFSLDDFEANDNDYIQKSKITSDEINKELDIQSKESLSRIVKAGDILYSNFKLDENGELLNFGNKEGEPIAVCAIPPYFLPDQEIRFISIKTGNFVKLINYDAMLKNNLQEEIGTTYFKCSQKDFNYGIIYSDEFDNGYDAYTSQVFSNKLFANPYLQNGKFNENWLAANCSPDILKGWETTKKLEKYFSSDLKNILNKFSAIGSRKLDWYLPSTGELCLAIAKSKELKAVSNIDFSKAYFVACLGVKEDEEITQQTQIVRPSAQSCNIENPLGHYYIKCFAHFKLSKNFYLSK